MTTKVQVYLRPLARRSVVGSVVEALPGDIVVFFDDQQLLTREVLRVDPKGQMVVTKPLMRGEDKIANSALVKWEDVDEIIRLEKPEPEPEPEPDMELEPLEPEPSPPPPPPPPPPIAIRAPGAALRPGDPGYVVTPRRK